VVEAIRGKHVIIHSICFHELVYAAHKLESDGKRDVENGLKLVRGLIRAYSNVVDKHRHFFEIEN